ncbi:MAG: aminotransferase class IV [Proteobacteria bacterium]|nr:aminotransferase class IV [Pseudomonadota bacterium]
MATPETPDRRLWIDGEWVPWERATVHVLSHSLQRGSLVFDYMSIHGTPRGDAVFRLHEHVERFLLSCALVGLPLERSGPELESAVLDTVRANPGSTALKMSAYLPSVEVDVVPVDDRVSVAIAAYDPVADILARKATRAPFKPELRLWIEKERRNRRSDILPAQAKVAANYTSPMAAKWKARRAGYDEIVLVDEDGYLAEGPTTNLFLVNAAGELCTPSERNVLLGITRRTVIELAKHDGIPVQEVSLEPQALHDAAEVFLTGTTAGVWPVVSVDDKTVGDGRPGPVTIRLREHFERVVSGRDPDFEHWLSYVER